MIIGTDQQNWSFFREEINDNENSSLTYSENNIWWKGEIVNRNISKYYQKLIQQIQIEINQLENEFLLKVYFF